MRGGNPNRPAGVGAHAGCGEARRDRSAGSAARSPWIARQIVGVAGLPAHRADRRDPGGELVQVGLADEHGAGIPQPLDLESVASGLKALERQRAAGRRHVGGRVVVLEDERNTVERSTDAAGPPLVIERGRLIERRRIERDERVDGPLVGLDAREIQLNQSPRGHRAVAQRPLQIGDVLLGDIERRGRRNGLRLTAGPTDAGSGQGTCAVANAAARRSIDAWVSSARIIEPL